MELIILQEGLYHLIPISEHMIVSNLNFFDLCDNIRLQYTTYQESINLHVMNDGSGNFFGCIKN